MQTIELYVELTTKQGESQIDRSANPLATTENPEPVIVRVRPPPHPPVVGVKDDINAILVNETAEAIEPSEYQQVFHQVCSSTNDLEQKP